MYIPASFSETDTDTLHRFIDQHSFATLVSRDGHEVVANHLPLLLDREAAPRGRLLGHMARANSQWRHTDGQSVLAIFSGPHAYISPTWYEAQNVVPTWNYVAVHVYGTLRLVEQREWLRVLLERTVAKYESAQPQPWNMQSPEPAFVEKLLDAIIGFEIGIERMEGKWKLSQNHDASRREKVRDKLLGEGDQAAVEIAELMRTN